MLNSSFRIAPLEIYNLDSKVLNKRKSYFCTGVVILGFNLIHPYIDIKFLRQILQEYVKDFLVTRFLIEAMLMVLHWYYFIIKSTIFIAMQIVTYKSINNAITQI